MRTQTTILLLLVTWTCIDGYRPVVIVHGIFDGPKQFKTLVLFINKTHPGTEVTVVDMYKNMCSLKPLWKQVQAFQRAIEPIIRKAHDGVHLLCFSQGGLICRALLSTMPDHNIHTFIALSSPLAGQFGDTYYLRQVFPDCVKDTVFLVCYNRVGQRVSICQYWNDPHHRSSYLKNNRFLPLLNGDIPHNNMTSWKQNFLRIKKLVLIGGPDDGVITPWQSSHFGFYDTEELVVEMQNQEFYRNDTFGLKTLSSRGDIALCLRPGVKHTHWHSNFTVFTECIEKWLT
ncbi:lysosomal thioesterase PPT2-A-like [Corythoichthys intestinalis]|uniref:lysosomal thioesterase PPT2-A-like n=1 Tax=Corythoichthys intestinalis TaxID=161448 RepID=UPI0025A5CAE0|nr:lysosomal thioesterase PPT2-A-like [Corythoichthys intestinalis]XP_061789439.1 lysosomal thioesterase PPT2-A-like [Nerophis lumbriciformis]